MPRPRFIIPEIIQTSPMDCGPAVLSAVLNGYRIPAGYDRLREACQTDLDGTSINVIEEILQAFDLDASQVMLPVDHLFLKSSPTLPAIFVVRQPNGLTHFVTVWRKLGGRLQVMDPAVGRYTLSIKEFKNKLFHHRFDVPAADWRTFAGSPNFMNPLHERLAKLGLKKADRAALMTQATTDEKWTGLATLDAAVRFAAALKKSGAVQSFDRPLLSDLVERSHPDHQPEPLIPWSYWSVEPAGPDEEGGPQLTLKGAVLIKLPRQGRPNPTPNPAALPELQDVVTAAPPHPWRLIWGYLRQDGLLNPLLLLVLLTISAGLTLIEALFWRGTLEFSAWHLTSSQQTALFSGFVFLLLLNLWLQHEKLGLGLHQAKQLEIRFRLAILRRLPHIQPRYFGTRPVSDMAERSHNLFRLREIPLTGSRIIEVVLLILFSTAALVVMNPVLAWLAVLNAAVAILLPYLAHRALLEKDLQVRTHVGALSQFYLDALRGSVPTRAHGAEQSILSEHEQLLVHWANARWELLGRMISYEALQRLLGTIVAVGYIGLHIFLRLPLSHLLLAAYWLLNTVDFGHELGYLARLYPTLRNHVLRAGELVSESPAEAPAAIDQDQNETPEPAGGVDLCLKKVTVKIGGQVTLEGVDVEIPAGQHVAIVGPSGAGKSTFIGTLLGWHVPATGLLHVDGRPLARQALDKTRQEAVWIDPAVQLWNRTLWDNIAYGLNSETTIPPAKIIEQAELLDFLERLPDGWRTLLGEDGRLVSGGEGQRVRYGRGISRENARLILLDEPFRGLDRPQRRRLLARARQKWAGATLLCVTHDLLEAESFDRVLFFFNGRLIQDGPPEKLKTIDNGPFAYYYRQDQALAAEIWGAEQWQRWKLNQGVVSRE